MMMMSGSGLVVVVVATLLVGCGECYEWNTSMSSEGREDYVQYFGNFRYKFIHGYMVKYERDMQYILLDDGVRLGVKMDAVIERFRVEGKRHLDNAVACLLDRKTNCFHIFEQMEDYILVDGMFNIYKQNRISNFEGSNAEFNLDDVWLGMYDYSKIREAMGSPLSVLNVTDELSEARFPKESSRRGLNKSAKLPASVLNAELSPTSFDGGSIKSSKSPVGSLTSGSSVGSKSPDASKRTATLDNGVLAYFSPGATTTEVNNKHLFFNLANGQFFIYGYQVHGDHITLFRGRQRVRVDAKEVHRKYGVLIVRRLTKIIMCLLEENCVGFHIFFIRNGDKMVIDGMFTVHLNRNYITFRGQPQLSFRPTTFATSHIFAKVKSMGVKLKDGGGVFLTVNADADIFGCFF